MANQHKLVITVQERRRHITIKFRGHGNILGLNLAGYNVTIPVSPLPTTLTNKEYVEAIFDLVEAELE